MTLFNTRRLIDSSYLVGGIHTVQVKIKSVIKRFNFINMFLFQFVGFVQVNSAPGNNYSENNGPAATEAVIAPPL